MAENRLTEVAGHWLPRMEVAGIPSATARAVMDEAGTWENWCRAWSEAAEHHAAIGARAEAAGHTLTAGEAYARAALMNHFAQFMFFDDLDQKAAATTRKLAYYERAAPFLAPPAHRLTIPFEGDALHAYQRVPAAPRGTVILVPGSDSTKEEFGALEENFLKRGMATVSLDGPGQGEGRALGPLRADISSALRALLDALTDAARYGGVGLVGMAFGGHLALRAAAALPELAAVVSINGFFELAGMWPAFPPVYRDNMRYALGGVDAADAEARAAAFTLAGAPPPACPALVLHGGRDRIFPPEEAKRQADWAGGSAALHIFPDGNHVCNNIPWHYRPMVADWIADRL
ncbi:alpha/beta hydrolase family protein [Acuticoccus kandeliae]|uniref:alpha/beta hydrolase family protein n=1 Tax=Acuticoccus kandeliae TaxID=2073160 RepID=UPI000D3EB920|nr:alpha/beta fold hydrolase [Acuticoccus kandeliae]